MWFTLENSINVQVHLRAFQISVLFMLSLLLRKFIDFFLFRVYFAVFCFASGKYPRIYINKPTKLKKKIFTSILYCKFVWFNWYFILIDYFALFCYFMFANLSISFFNSGWKAVRIVWVYMRYNWIMASKKCSASLFIEKSASKRLL